jgi:hypothetical protein
MAEMMRKCSQCGTVDRRASWSSAADAAKDDAFNRPWTCASCAWTEFDLVEAEAEATNPQATAGRR